MLKKHIKYLKERRVTIALLIALFSLGYSGFIHYQSGSQSDDKIVAVINAQAANQAFYEGYRRVSDKIQNYSNLGIQNDTLGLKIFDYYEKALVKAGNRDEEYLVFEFLGDTIIESYMEGIKDGKRAFLGQM